MDLELLKKTSRFFRLWLSVAAKCRKLLADIHGINKQDTLQQYKEVHIDWDGYLERLAAANRGLYGLIAPNRDLLYGSQTKGNIV